VVEAVFSGIPLYGQRSSAICALITITITITIIIIIIIINIIIIIIIILVIIIIIIIIVKKTTAEDRYTARDNVTNSGRPLETKCCCNTN
jgi:c-di-AMP phosphodiesterase-like protein